MEKIDLEEYVSLPPQKKEKKKPNSFFFQIIVVASVCFIIVVIIRARGFSFLPSLFTEPGLHLPPHKNLSELIDKIAVKMNYPSSRIDLSKNKSLAQGANLLFSPPSILQIFNSIAYIWDGDRLGPNETTSLEVTNKELTYKLFGDFLQYINWTNSDQVDETGLTTTTAAILARKDDGLERWYVYVKNASDSCIEESMDANVSSTEIIRKLSGKSDSKIKPNLQLDLRTVNPQIKTLVTKISYFDNSWQHPFDVKNTKLRKFYFGKNGEMENGYAYAQIETMSNEAEIRYYGDDPRLQFSAIGLPYKNNIFHLFIVLPKIGVHLQDVKRSMATDDLIKIVQKSRLTKVRYSVPKMKLDAEYHENVRHLLESLDVKISFDYLGQDLSSLKISLKLSVDVNEIGSDSVASAPQSKEVSSTAPIQFAVDRPFLFFIYDESVETTVFWGEVYEPPTIPQSKCGKSSCDHPSPTHNMKYTIECPVSNKFCDWEKNIDENAWIRYQCNDGYARHENNEFLSVCSCGEWLPPLKKCPRKCDPIKPPTNSILTCRQSETGPEIPCNGTLLEGAVVSNKCKINYISGEDDSNQEKLVCKEEGKWNNEPCFCVPICDAPGSELLDPRIFGGKLEKPGGSPWFVSIYKKTGNFSLRDLICGGTLISSRHVLSAAHCFPDFINSKVYNKTSSTLYYYAIISYNVTQSDQQSEIKNIEIHPDYSGETTKYYADIAVITLSQEVQNDEVYSACFDWEGSIIDNFESSAENPTLKVSGFGRTENETYPWKLMTAQMPYINYQNCLELYKDNQSELSRDKFCAGSKNASYAKSGDSGGGALFRDSKNGRYYVLGVVSTSMEKIDWLTRFTNISTHKEWIKNCICFL